MKSGIDWEEIERRVKAGESYRGISRVMADQGTPISHVGIAKRARKLGWKANGHERWLTETKGTDAAKRIKNPQTLADIRVAQFGKRSPENAARILECLAQGASQNIAAQTVGIDPHTLSRWKKEDADFERMMSMARGEFLIDRIGDITAAAKRGDWKAAARFLETAPETKEEWGQDTQGHGGINVILNFPSPTEKLKDITPKEIEQ